MKKTAVWILALAFLAGGCVTAKKVVRDRVDQDLNAGNRGFVEGAAPAPQDRKKTREYIQVDVQTPFTLPAGPYQPKADEVAEAERQAKVEPMAPVSVPQFSEPEPSRYEEPQAVEPVQPTPAATEVRGGGTYKVQKGDTLSEISQKVYGKAKYWKKILEANQPPLSDPDRLREGMVLNLPEIEVAAAAPAPVSEK